MNEMIFCVSSVSPIEWRKCVFGKGDADRGNQRCDKNRENWIGFESIYVHGKLTGNMSLLSLVSDVVDIDFYL